MESKRKMTPHRKYRTTRCKVRERSENDVYGQLRKAAVDKNLEIVAVVQPMLDVSVFSG